MPSLRSASAFLLVTLQGCSFQDIPGLGPAAGGDGAGGMGVVGGGGGGVGPGGGGGGGGGGGTVCGGQPVDLLASSDHCGECDNACIAGLSCVGGSCLVAGAPSSGAWALGLESASHLIWAPAEFATSLQRTSVLDGSTETKFPMIGVWDLKVIDGIVGVIPAVAFPSFDPNDTQPPQWFRWSDLTPQTFTCPVGSCDAFDLANSDVFLAWTTSEDTWILDQNGPADVTASAIPGSLLAYSRSGYVAIGQFKGLPSNESSLRIATSVVDFVNGTLIDTGGSAVWNPNALAFIGNTLYWLDVDETVKCLPENGPMATYLSVAGTAPFSLHAMWNTQPATGKLVISLLDGRIVRGPNVCEPQTTIEVLSEPPVADGVLVSAMTSVNDPGADLFFAQLSTVNNPKYGGIFVRAGTAPPIRTIAVP